MEKSQNLVATNAKSRHKVGAQLAPFTRSVHVDPRFYTWSGKLVNSIHPLKVQVFVNGLKGEVVAGEPYATRIEIGSANSRAFPFFGPAIVEESPGIIILMGTAVAKVIK